MVSRYVNNLALKLFNFLLYCAILTKIRNEGRGCEHLVVREWLSVAALIVVERLLVEFINLVILHVTNLSCAVVTHHNNYRISL